MRDLEHQCAVAFVQWWAVFANTMKLNDRLLWATPNGSVRHPVVAMKLKAEGVRAGVSDYFLALPRNHKHGLFIELKKGGIGVSKGYATPEQLSFGAMVQEQGYAFTVAHGALEAEQAIEKYLGLVL